jgi:hypothetical protein
MGETPPPQPVALQSSIFTDIYHKIREIGQERALMAAMEQLEKPENQELAATQIRKLPEPGKSAVINALRSVTERASMPGGRRARKTSRRRTHKGGNLGAVQQMIANKPYTDQPITANTVYRNPWGGRRRKTGRGRKY